MFSFVQSSFVENNQALATIEKSPILPNLRLRNVICLPVKIERRIARKKCRSIARQIHHPKYAVDYLDESINQREQ